MEADRIRQRLRQWVPNVSKSVSKLCTTNPSDVSFCAFLSFAEETILHTAMEILTIMKLEDYAQEYAKNLPYGLQRKVEIVRALVVEPKLSANSESPWCPKAAGSLGT